MACGTPVVAYGAGGARETVIEGETGTFFAERSVASLIDAMERIEVLKIDPEAGRRRAREFSRPRFLARVREEIDTALKGSGVARGERTHR
jgi:glycosyltransferase involved in cell wall biosynthesis